MNGPRPWGAVGRWPTSRPTPPQEDLLRAALLSDEPALAAWRRVRPLLRVAELDTATQAVIPQLRRNLVELGCDDPLLDLFKGVHRYGWARNQLMLAQVMPVIGALEHAGVPTLLLKGAALIANRRRGAGMRHMTDVDVLVPPAQVPAAYEILIEHGMAPVEAAPLWYLTDYAPRFTNSWNFRDAAEGQLDLHWHALRFARSALADEDLWSQATAVELHSVRTRSLCPADELLLVIVHGLRWSPTPPYRWVLDAALLARGQHGAMDYERLVVQARRRRLGTAARAGLLYLRSVAAIDVPAGILRELQGAAPLERLELRGQSKPDGRRSRLERAATMHVQDLRRRLPPGARATPVAHARLAAERVGAQRVADLRHLRSGQIPGPGRPQAEDGAPIGTGECAPPPLRWGAPLDFGDRETARAHCRFGLWLADGPGSWTAGHEARLVVTLPEPADSSLLLALALDGLLSDRRPRQRLEVLVDDRRVAELELDIARPRPGDEVIVLPAALVRGRRALELALRTPDATAPARIGIGDDQRSLGVLLRSITVRRPLRWPAGRRVALGAGTEDVGMLAGGWSESEPEGRWTHGPAAQILLRTSPPEAGALAWRADPLTALGGPPLRVEVTANGIALGAVDYDRDPRTVQLPLGRAAAADELLVRWRIRDPWSPKDLGLSEDSRPLGLFFRDVALIPR